MKIHKKAKELIDIIISRGQYVPTGVDDSFWITYRHRKDWHICVARPDQELIGLMDRNIAAMIYVELSPYHQIEIKIGKRLMKKLIQETQ